MMAFKSRREGPKPLDTDNFNPNTMMSMSMFMPLPMHDFVFRGNESVDLRVAEKRIEHWRKKHPEDFEALNTLEKKAYPEGLEVKKIEPGQNDTRTSGQVIQELVNSWNDAFFQVLTKKVMRVEKKRT